MLRVKKNRVFLPVSETDLCSVRSTLCISINPSTAQQLTDATQGKYAAAKPLYERYQAIQEKVVGPEHPDLSTTLGCRAEMLRCQIGISLSC